MSNSKPKLNILSVKKIKDNTLSTKYLFISSMIMCYSDNFSNEAKIINKTHGYNTRSKEERKMPTIEEDDILGNIECTKIAVKALKEALNENEKVRI
jgi:hypothetical protein